METFQAHALTASTKHHRGQVQVVTLLCISCGETGTRTMRPGGQPRYCDACNDPKLRAQLRKQRQRERQKQNPTEPLLTSQAPHSAPSQNSNALLEGVASLHQSCDSPQQGSLPIPIWQSTSTLGKLPSFGVRPLTPAPDHPAVLPLTDEEKASVALRNESFETALTAAWFALTPRRLGKEFIDQSCWGHFVPYETLAQALTLPLGTFLQQLAQLQPFALKHSPEQTALTFCNPLLAWNHTTEP